MKIRIYLYVHQFEINGYGFQVIPAITDFLGDSKDHRFIQEISCDLDIHLPWICQRAQEVGSEMAKEATNVYNRATARRLEFEAKFLQLEHIPNSNSED